MPFHGRRFFCLTSELVPREGIEPSQCRRVKPKPSHLANRAKCMRLLNIHPPQVLCLQYSDNNPNRLGDQPGLSLLSVSMAICTGLKPVSFGRQPKIISIYQQTVIIQEASTHTRDLTSLDLLYFGGPKGNRTL